MRVHSRLQITQDVDDKKLLQTFGIHEALPM